MVARQHSILVGSIIASCILFGCSKRQLNKSEVISFKKISLNESHQLKDNKTLPILNIDLQLEYPETYSDDAILKKVKRTMFVDFFPGVSDTSSNPIEAMKLSIQNRIKYYEKSENLTDQNKIVEDVEGLETTSNKNWWDKTALEIKYNANGLLSYSVRSDQFTGGNRAGINIQNSIIDLTTGEKIHEENLFSEDALKLINQIILSKLTDKYKVKSTEELEQIGFFDLSEIFQYKNIYITEKGVTYTYNAYEIGSYDLGTIEIELTFDDLQDMIAPDSPLNRIHRY